MVTWQIFADTRLVPWLGKLKAVVHEICMDTKFRNYGDESCLIYAYR
jgi:hypothetical protein